MFGSRWEWPPSDMSVEQDLEDLLRHEREMETHRSFNYCVLDAHESQLFGCVYVDPPEDDSPEGADAEICWWVVDAAVGSELERCLGDFVPRWIADDWPFRAPSLGLWWLGHERT